MQTGINQRRAFGSLGGYRDLRIARAQLLEHGGQLGPVGVQLHRADAGYGRKRGFARRDGSSQGFQGPVVEHRVGGLSR